MTKEQFQIKFAHLNADEYIQHSNGGGWKSKTSTVEETVFIGENAQVYGNASVYGNAWVSGNARVYGDARVSGDARVYGDAWVSGNAWVFSPLYIQGSAHSITVCSFTEISIGCEKHTIEYWKTNYRKIGKKYGYTDSQIEEYSLLINMASNWVDMMIHSSLK